MTRTPTFDATGTPVESALRTPWAATTDEIAAAINATYPGVVATVDASRSGVVVCDTRVVCEMRVATVGQPKPR